MHFDYPFQTHIFSQVQFSEKLQLLESIAHAILSAISVSIFEFPVCLEVGILTSFAKVSPKIKLLFIPHLITGSINQILSIKCPIPLLPIGIHFHASVPIVLSHTIPIWNPISL